MCGIVGILGNTEKPINIAVLSMRDVFPYRGPDAEGLWVNESAKIALGHRRLSIIDVSSAGNQPMSYAGERYWITYNGEIYNYIELRRELEGKGYTFRTQSDTEVLLAAFCQWGSGCLSKFNGMWAFAIWDSLKCRLFLARDRLGIKPLYYYCGDGAFYFASEIKAILRALPMLPEIETQLIDAYMSFGYVPGENTLFRGIKRVLPGHFLEKNKIDLVTRKYWDLSYESCNDRGFDDCVREARNILEDSVRLRLRSDVPLGIFLSGGLDSSTVVGLLAQKVTTPLKTFSVAYDFGHNYNETPYARIIARQFNTDHHEVFVTPEQFRDFVPEFVWRMDEPITEAAAISLFFVSQVARGHVTVVLSGEGADEVFAGYDLYRYMLVLEKCRRLLGPTLMRTAAKQIGSRLLVGSKAAKYLMLGAAPLESRYRGISDHDRGYKTLLYNESFSSFLTERKEDPLRDFLDRLFSRTRAWSPLSRMLYFDLKTWLVDDLLIKADRMSMGASLELRVPFLDYRLLEFASRMKPSYMLHHGTGKYVLKRMMENVLPKEIVHRKKMGFPAPLKIMLEGPLRGFAEDMLLSSCSLIRSYFKREQIEKILKEHKTQTMDHHRVIWQLIVLETWLQIYVRGGGGFCQERQEEAKPIEGEAFPPCASKAKIGWVV